MFCINTVRGSPRPHFYDESLFGAARYENSPQFTYRYDPETLPDGTIDSRACFIVTTNIYSPIIT